MICRFLRILFNLKLSYCNSRSNVSAKQKPDAICQEYLHVGDLTRDNIVRTPLETLWKSFANSYRKAIPSFAHVDSVLFETSMMTLWMTALNIFICRVLVVFKLVISIEIDSKTSKAINCWFLFSKKVALKMSGSYYEILMINFNLIFRK